MISPFQSEQFWGAVITILIVLGKILDQWNAGRSKDQKNQIAEDQSKKVEEVKKALVETTTDTTHKLDEIKVVADKTHVLSNSRYGDSLKLTASTARSLANYTKSPVDITAADLAEAMLKEHVEKQAIVDAQEADKGETK
jgi:hypothetical protein